MADLVRKLNELNLSQTAMPWVEGLPQDIWDEIKDTYKEIKNGLDVDKHRWYETSISVFEVDGHLYGVRSVTDLFSEMMGVKDVYWQLHFMPMIEKATITYVPLPEPKIQKI